MELKLIESLSSPQLTLIAEHLKLGEEHLKNLLGEKEFEKLLEFEDRHFSALQTDAPESAGKALLTFNSVATGIVGVLLGYTKLLGISLHSTPLLLGILGVAFLLGSWAGYQSFRFVKNQARGAIRKQKLNCLQLQILELIHFKKKSKLPSEQEAPQIRPLLEPHQDSPLYEIFKGEIEENLAELKEEKKAPQPQKIPLVQKLLSETPIVSRKKISWWKRNRKYLAIGLLPTLFGGLSTLLSFRGQTSRIAEELGKRDFFANPSPFFLKIQLLTALLITVYFAFSFLHENWKAFLRDRDREKLEERIIEKESALTLLDARLLKAEKRQKALQRLENVLRALKEFPTIKK